MRLTRESAQIQAARLQANPMICPQSKEGKTEVVDCLLRHCQDKEHAERTMTAFLDNARQVQNLTAELADAARGCRNPETAPPGCDGCRRDDPFTGAVDWMPHVYSDRGGVSCAVRCSCERGRWLAGKDEARGSEEPVAPKRLAKVAAVDVAKRAAGDRE